VQPGDFLDNRFRILDRVGSGGMGSVYRAVDTLTGADVAVKVSRDEAPAQTARFLREAQALAALQHPAIVRYVHHGVDALGRAYLVMEWLEGHLLSRRLAVGPLGVAETVALMQRLSHALAAVHARGYVHRDVKPGNVMLVDDRVDRAKLLDFGVAYSEHDGHEETDAGVLIGTPGYLAPEQARLARVVDGRADVFALGCVMFRCLTGKAVFSGDTVASLLAQVLFAPIPLPGQVCEGVPGELDAIAARMLARAPSDRFADGAELAAAFDQLAVAGFRAGARRAGVDADEHRLMAVLRVGTSWAEETIAEPPGAARASHVDDERARSLAERFGGRYEMLFTGEVVVTFMGEHAATDLARRAVRCALAWRGHDPNRRMALVLGSARVSTLTMGEVFDRVEHLATAVPACPGVRVDDAVASLVAGRFLVHRDEAGAWVAEERAGFDDVGGLFSRKSLFRGRDREMSLLRETLARCVRERVCQAVVVTGEPGMGKSRLRMEFQRSIASDSVQVWFGAADPLRPAAPLLPVERMLRAQVGLFGPEPGPVAWARLQAHLRFYVPAGALERIALFVGEFLGITPPEPIPDALVAACRDPKLMGEQVRRALLDLIQAVCEREPLLLVLDDLHVADTASVELLDEALRRCSTRPLMVLGLGRPEAVSGPSGVPWRVRGAIHVQLRPLPEEAARSLVEQALEAYVNAPMRDEIVARAAGNPFFLEELVRHQAEGSVGGLPRSLVAMVQARLERLAPEVRRVLRGGSVFGSSFCAEGVQAVLGLPERAVLPVLDMLVHEDVLVAAEQRPRVYAFRHALLAEASYEMLTPEDRIQGHRLAASWLKSRPGVDLAVVAEHWQRGSCLGEAARSFAAAAERAREQGALGAAIEHAERGLRCTDAPALTCHLLALQAEAHAWRGELERAVDAARRAHQVLGGPPEAMARSTAVAADSLARLGNIEDAVDAIERLLRLPIPTSLESRRLADACAALGSLLTTSKASRACLDRLRAELDRRVRPEHLDDPAVAAARCRLLAWWSLLVDDDPEQYLLWSLEAVRAAKAAGDLRRAAEASHDAGFAYIMVGDHLAAAATLRDGLTLAERLGLGRAAATCDHNLGLALARTGAISEALDVESRALQAFETQGYPRFVTACRIYLAEILRVAGRTNEALQAASAAVHGAEPGSDVYVLALAQLAQAQLDEGLVHEAQVTERALRVLPALPLQEEGEQIRVVRAQVLLACGEHVEAQQLLAEARARILAKASRIRNPQRREQFMHCIPANARALSLASAR